jgi:hypothetical protein
VSGSLTITTSGSSLEIDLGAHAKLGKLIKRRLPAGVFKFTVKLNHRGVRGLDKSHRLHFGAKTTVTPPHGAPASTTTTVTLTP